MTAKIGLRELARNISKLDHYDYLEIEDKKTHQSKGIFVPAKYADEFKEYLEKRLEKERQEYLDEIMPFVGSIEIKEEFKNLKTSKELREAVAKAKYGK